MIPGLRVQLKDLDLKAGVEVVQDLGLDLEVLQFNDQGLAALNNIR